GLLAHMMSLCCSVVPCERTHCVALWCPVRGPTVLFCGAL
ncbi:hypothetical protein A2U01_0117298, partial [Trifolium medium]|nr:hypothetical protein [Trifolium medium]